MKKPEIDVKPNELKKLNKIMRKLSYEYDTSEHKPLRQARIEKRAMKTQKRIDYILGKTDNES